MRKQKLYQYELLFFGWVAQSAKQVIYNMVNGRWGKVGLSFVESTTTVFNLNPWHFARISKLCTFHYGIV